MIRRLIDGTQVQRGEKRNSCVRGEGRSGVITECAGSTYTEYHVIPDGEDKVRIYSDRNLECEDVMDMEVKDKYFFEMAGRIPGELKVYDKCGDILIIAVGADETGGEAHFHVFRSKKDLRAWKNGACLMFKENRYFEHGDNRETLTKDELNAVINCLNAKPAEGLPGETYWQYLICLWNGNNYDFRIDLGTPVLDYNYETITRYKEKDQETD